MRVLFLVVDGSKFTKFTQHRFPNIYIMFHSFLAHDAFVRTNRRAIPMMFVRPSVWDGRAL